MSEEFSDGPIGVFAWALYNMKQGKAVKRIGWLGYWTVETFDRGEQSEHQDIVMHCKDGSIVKLSSGCDPMLTAENMAANDWMIVDSGLKNELDKIAASGCLKPVHIDDDGIPF